MTGEKGGFLSIEPDHSGWDMYHAVLEGVLYNLLQCMRELEALNGRPRAIKLSGGIVHSPYWTQMCADIMGLPMDVSWYGAKLHDRGGGRSAYNRRGNLGTPELLKHRRRDGFSRIMKCMRNT